MPVDGVYKIVSKTPVGDQPAKLTLKTDGTALSGTSEEPLSGVTTFNGGTVDGDTFAFSMSPMSPYGELALELTGRVDGDLISGDVMSMFGPATFSGTRI